MFSIKRDSTETRTGDREEARAIFFKLWSKAQERKKTYDKEEWVRLQELLWF